MGIKQDFRSLALDELIATCRDYKERGYRLTQIAPKLERDDSITLVYTFVMGPEIVNFKVEGIVKGETEVPSVTELFISCFVYENEAHDLFGVNVVGNVIDFQGAFYSFAEDVEAPMTIISPEQLAAREKAAKLAAAKAAREAKAKAKESGAEQAAADDLEAKLAGMDPEKAAKVRAAMEAKAKKAAEKEAASSDDIEARLAGMDPEKAAKVRAAMEAKAKRAAEKAVGEDAASREGE